MPLDSSGLFLFAEAFKNRRLSTEDYCNLIEVRLAGAKRDDFKRKGVYGFSIDPRYCLYLSSQAEPHINLQDTFGVEMDYSLAEGYMYVNDDGAIENVDFKPHPYQPQPGFTGTDTERLNLHNGARLALSRFFDLS